MIASSVQDSVPRFCTESKWVNVSKSQIKLLCSYSGFNPKTNKRVSHLEIGDCALDMIRNSKDTIVASAFLFDVMTSNNNNRDIAKEITDTLIEKKRANPNIKITIMLDPINAAYDDYLGRESARLLDAGIDIFYSDLVSTPSATIDGISNIARRSLRFADDLTGGILIKTLSLVTSIEIPIKNELNENGISINSVWNAVALKANHRKLLVTDNSNTHELEALIGSANPHSASIPSENFAVWVRGDIANYIYMLIRADVAQSIKVRNVRWATKDKNHRKNYLKDTLGAIEVYTSNKPLDTSKQMASIITEGQIKKRVLALLSSVKKEDKVRIQMFYLSELEVVDAIVEAAKVTDKPIRIILDPNKDAFGSIKDGTPNRQVGAYLMQKKKEYGLNLEIRWYQTHGEQNHAKIMTISSNSRSELITGSANWSGKNINNINMESDIHVKNANAIVAQYNKLFDMFWNNTGDLVYTCDYSEYKKHTGMGKWRNGERFGYVQW